MPGTKRYRRLKGDSAYYPFGARTALRRRQRRQAALLWVCGLAALCLAAVLGVRQWVFRGGQPEPPAPAVLPASAETAATPEHARTPVTVRPVTVDALAATADADADAQASPAPAPSPDAETEAAILPAYRELYAENPDLVGWLRVDGTNIDYPVLQTPGDNEYYLRRGFDRLYATSGSLFLDERCRITPDPTANWLIYGHNMADGSMFGELDAYANEDFWREHPTFTFDTLTEPGTWAVVAVLRTELGADELPYYTFFDAADRADWQARVDAILALALYDTGVKPEYGDQLLTLSTCGTSSVYTDARFALLAVRVA